MGRGRRALAQKRDHGLRIGDFRRRRAPELLDDAGSGVRSHRLREVPRVVGVDQRGQVRREAADLDRRPGRARLPAQLEQERDAGRIEILDAGGADHHGTRRNARERAERVAPSIRRAVGRDAPAQRDRDGICPACGGAYGNSGMRCATARSGPEPDRSVFDHHGVAYPEQRLEALQHRLVRLGAVALRRGHRHRRCSRQQRAGHERGEKELAWLPSLELRAGPHAARHRPNAL
jgi:hypothetical protein